MLKASIFLLAVSPLVAAWPVAMQQMEDLEKRFVNPPYRAPAMKINRPNTGLPASGFNHKDQYVDVTPGSGHHFIPPGPTDTRGECPGLNAAANHGFLNRNGITTINQAIQGLGAAYNMGVDLAGFLAVLAVGLSGDPITQKWSIGEGIQTTANGKSRGLYGLHNKYEGDASIMRGDAYLNGGEVSIFKMRAFEHMYSLGKTFTFNEAAAQSDYKTRYSILNNPYYFSAPFSGLVAPAAHNLVINLMSNHSAAVPGGTLTREVLKSFFSVKGEPGSFVYTVGHERIPLNWYRRPTADAHNIPEVLVDLGFNNGAYPGIIRFGGNSGKTNSFQGVSVSKFSDGQYGSIDELTKGDKGACFLLQASLVGLPDAADPALGAAGSVLNWVLEQFKPLQKKFGCPQLTKFDNTFFNQFPGANYTGSGVGK